MASVSELSNKFAPQLAQLQAIFPSWDESDLVFALQDSKGNVEETVLAISEGRASQFTQATKKKAPKPAGQNKTHGSRNADSGGWESAETFGGRGGRGGRGGARGGRGAARGGMNAVRGGTRGGRGGARGGRGGYGGVNGKDASAGGPSDAWPTTTETTVEGWTNQVEQAEKASAHEDDGGWGDDATASAEPSKSDDFAAAGGWGDAPAAKEVEAAAKSGTTAWQTEAQKPVQVAKSSVPASVTAAPAAKPKMTWAQIAKPIDKPKPTPPPAPKAPEPQPEPAVEETAAEPEVEEEQATEASIDAFGDAPAASELQEQAAAALEPEQEESPEEPAAEEPDMWSDPAIASATPAAAPEPVTTYTGPPGFNTVASKAVGSQQPRTNSRGSQRFKNADGQAVVLPAAASGVSSVEMQFGSLSFGGLNGDGVEAPVSESQPEPAAVASSPVRTQAQAQPQQTQSQTQSQASQPSQPQSQTQSHYQQETSPSGYQSQAQNAYQSYQQQQPQESQQSYGYRQDGYYGAASTQQQQQPQQQQHESHPSQQQQSQGQQQQPQHSYEGQQFGSFGNQFGQPGAQHSEYGSRNFDSYSTSGYPRPPAEEPKAPAPAPGHSTGPAQPQQNLPHQQSQYYSALGNMGYYHPQGPYNPYYQYGQTHQPGFQQYYPMAGRQLYGQPAPQPPAPIPASKPNPPSHSPYGQPPTYPSSGFDEFSGLGRYGDSKTAAPSGGAQGSTPQPIGGSSLPQSSGAYQQQGLHNFLGGMSTPGSGSGSAQPNRPQAGTPDDSYKTGTSASSSATASNTAASRQPQQPQQFQSYPYGGYQSHDWSPYGQQQHQHYSQQSRNGYSGWQQ